MKKLVLPINPYRAMMNGGSKNELFNSKDKMIKYIKFNAENFYGKLDCLKSMHIYPGRPVYNVFKDLIDRNITGEITNIFNCGLCEYTVDKETGRPLYEIYYISQEERETVYVFDISCLELLKAHSIDSCNILIECVSWFGKKGICVLEHPYMEYTEWYYVAESIVDRANYLEDEEKEDFILDIYKWCVREEHRTLYSFLNRHQPTKERLKGLVDRFSISAQYQVKIKEFAQHILSIYDCHPVFHYSEESRNYFLDQNDLSYDKDEHESSAVNYEDLFFISWEPSSISSGIISDSITGYANEYGQIEYFVKYPIYNYDDFGKYKVIDFRDHAALTDFPQLFRKGVEMSESIEIYLNEKYKSKWLKEIKKHLNPLTVDTLSKFTGT